MTTMSKKELISATKARYLKSGKKAKGKILDEFCATTGYARKYAIAILAAGHDHKRVATMGRKAREPKYGSDVILVVEKIWELLDFPCGVRLQPSLPEMYNALARHKEISFDEKIKIKLAEIGAKTIDRRLKKERERRHLRRNRGTTRHGSLLKSAIPIRITDWDTGTLGFTEIDTVAHNGGDPSGECAFTLDVTEIYSGWTEQYAVLGKGETGVLKGLKNIRQSLPFSLKGLDGDNGGEIINYHMLRYCTQEKLVYTRSRPDRKNDNAYIEQKNDSHVRRIVGYGRYDSQRQVKQLNALYRNEYRLFTNLFRPVMKIKSKAKINNSICRKTYDQARSPYQRLLRSRQMKPADKDKLTRLYLSLNPVYLKQAIDRQAAQIRATAK
jgi:hypothetical protein